MQSRQVACAAISIVLSVLAVSAQTQGKRHTQRETDRQTERHTDSMKQSVCGATG